MPKIARELSALEVKSLSGHGWHAVGGVAGLLLQVKCEPDTGKVLSRSWILRKRIGGKRQPIGLGSYPQTSLADARNKARTLSFDAQNGVDLLAKKREQRSAAIAAEHGRKHFGNAPKPIWRHTHRITATTNTGANGRQHSRNTRIQRSAKCLSPTSPCHTS